MARHCFARPISIPSIPENNFSTIVQARVVQTLTRYIEDLRPRMISDGQTVDERGFRNQASDLAHKTIQRNFKGDLLET